MSASQGLGAATGESREGSSTMVRSMGCTVGGGAAGSSSSLKVMMPGAAARGEAGGGRGYGHGVPKRPLRGMSRAGSWSSPAMVESQEKKALGVSVPVCSYAP